MEETLTSDRFISLHRNQINPQAMPMSTLTFAYGNLRYGKLPHPHHNHLTNLFRDAR